MNQLEQRVREIDAGVRAIGEAAAASEGAPVVRELPGGLGSVTVDGLGTLISVNLNRNALGTQNGSALSRLLLQEITAAEEQARARHDAMVGEARRQAGL
ncbi:hypothetical protein ACPZ19_09410 [Amycolatopsis lurida]